MTLLDDLQAITVDGENALFEVVPDNDAEADPARVSKAVLAMLNHLGSEALLIAKKERKVYIRQSHWDRIKGSVRYSATQ
jgi:hypothetical protein